MSLEKKEVIIIIYVTERKKLHW